MMAVFFFIALEKGFTFHAQPQTDAYSFFHLKAISISPFILIMSGVLCLVSWEKKHLGSYFRQVKCHLCIFK